MSDRDALAGELHAFRYGILLMPHEQMAAAIHCDCTEFADRLIAAGVTMRAPAGREAPNTDRLRALTIIDASRERCALAATPEPTPAPPAALDVDFAQAAIDYGSIPSSEFDRKYPDWSASPEFEDGLRDALAATTTKPQATKPPNSDQYDVVIPEPERASEYGRLLAERDRLIGQGVDPAALEVPDRPR